MDDAFFRWREPLDGGRDEGGIPLLDSLIAAKLETVKALNCVCPATLDIAATGLEDLMKRDIMYVFVVFCVGSLCCREVVL